ncbi:MAG: site-specific DNA-methyltransferase, partial [Phycisphaerales bacterium]
MAMKEFLNKVICGDCIEVLDRVREPFADLIFADPPFNIGYKYDKYYDKVKKKNYIAWTRAWMAVCKNALKPHGSFYVAIGDDYAANVKIIADELGLTMRNWIIWHYTFGQQLKNKFSRSHTHIFYFVKDKNNFTFNDHSARVISDRQKKYQDKRANPEGKMPDDVWDEYPRLCGTFKERIDFPCQMPESLLARVIRVSSDKGNWVLDPFSGSGTTAVVAHKLNRVYTGIDISKNYVQEAERRIRESEGLPIEGESKQKWNEHLEAELKWLYHENKVPTEQLEDDPVLLTLFSEKFNKRVGKTRNPFQPK